MSSFECALLSSRKPDYNNCRVFSKHIEGLFVVMIVNLLISIWWLGQSANCNEPAKSPIFPLARCSQTFNEVFNPGLQGLMFDFVLCLQFSNDGPNGESMCLQGPDCFMVSLRTSA